MVIINRDNMAEVQKMDLNLNDVDIYLVKTNQHFCMINIIRDTLIRPPII